MRHASGVLILAIGSRGDVAPMAVLAGALVRRGVPARVVALAEYADLVAEHGAGFVGVPGRLADALAAARTPLGRFALASPAGQGVALNRWVASFAAPLADAVLDAARPDEPVLTTLLTRDVATALAEASGRRVATVVYTGQLPTVQRESHFFASWFGRWATYNRWGTRLNWQIASNLGSPAGRAVRRRLGLALPSAAAATAAADRHPVIVAASPTLVPPAPDWPAGTHQTGYLGEPPTGYEPDAALADFLAADPAVYVGFGSLTGGTGYDLALLVEASERAGRRLVTPAPPGTAPGRVTHSVWAIGSLPYTWLFGQCAAVVHHGGAGTTQEGLRAGVPSAALPIIADQPYHGSRLHQLGVGPAPLAARRLTATRLAALLRDLTDGPNAAGYRTRAASVAARMRAEDGVTATLALLDRLGFTGTDRPPTP